MVGTNDETINLPSAIEEAIGELSDLFAEMPVGVVAETPAHLPAVEGSHPILVRVLTSLIAHVVAETNSGQIRIHAGLLPTGDVDIRASDQEMLPPGLASRGLWGKVTISDVQDQISLASYIIQNSDSPPQDFTEGDEQITLPACKGIVRDIGGYLWAERRAGVGSRIHLVLPLHAAGEVSADLSSLRRVVDTRLLEEAQFAKTLLLLAEDSAKADLLTAELSEAGYHVFSTVNGREILQLAREEQPDLILLDLLARDPIALDVAHVLKRDRRTQGIPVLFLTSVDDPQVGLKMGTVDFVVRSVGTGALLGTINAVLRSGIGPTARVLVVEPDDVLRENMVMMIQAHGYRVTVASSPEEAQALAERVEPGITLVNAVLAQERNYWLLRGLRRILEDCDIFVLADAMSDDEVQTAISRGASGYSETGKLPDLLNRVREKQAGD